MWVLLAPAMTVATRCEYWAWVVTRLELEKEQGRDRAEGQTGGHEHGGVKSFPPHVAQNTLVTG